MKNHYDTLGVSKTATAAEIKAAYRKLAQQHHPDKGGDAEKFKEISAANDVLSNEKKRAEYDAGGDGSNRSHDESDISEILRAMHAHAEYQRRNAVQFVRIQLSLEQAYYGATVTFKAYGQDVEYTVRPGLPVGVSFTDEVTVGGSKRAIQIQMLVDSGAFQFKQLGSLDGYYYSGDLEAVIDVDALDILLGGWIETSDFLGKTMNVRIPQGFEVRHRLKVANCGYSNWVGKERGGRGDLYLRVNPVFKPLDKLDLKKVERLYNSVKPQEKADVA